jgi:hypothetical protein
MAAADHAGAAVLATAARWAIAAEVWIRHLDTFTSLLSEKGPHRYRLKGRGLPQFRSDLPQHTVGGPEPRVGRDSQHPLRVA